MEYISIGTDKLLEEYFYGVVNGSIRIKPAGGLWLSGYYAPSFIDWIDYIVKKPTYYSFYKSPTNPFNMKGVIVKVSDRANIFTVDSNEACE